MRRSLLKLNERHLPKALRQALVLITMLLLPSTAWGQYPFTISGTPITSENIETYSGVSYDETSYTITLSGATNLGQILWSDSHDLTIALSGNNSIQASPDSATHIRSEYKAAKLTFKKVGDEASLSMAQTDQGQNAPSIISGFASINYDGMYLQTNVPTKYESKEIASGSTINSLVSALYNSTYNGYACIHSATITSTETYPIWVYNTSTTKYTQLTASTSYTTPEANVDDNHKGSVSYSANTLILDNFFCKTTNNSDYVFYIGENLESLTVDLVGTNEILYYCFNYLKPTDGEKLQLTYTTSSNGSLEFTGGPTYNNVDDENCTYKNGLGFYANKISTDWPRLIVGNKQITGTVSSVEGYDNISYDDDKNILTLSGTTIGTETTTATSILVYIKDLKVAISGNNILYGRFYGEYQENGSRAGNISFQNADFANASLTITVNNLGPIENFTECTLDNGLKITEAKNYIDGNNTVDVDVDGISYVDGNFKNGEDVPDYLKIAYQAPQLTVAGIEPDENGVISGDGISSGTVTFTPADNTVSPAQPATLTLEGATIDGYISSSIESLTVYLKGSSTINAGTGISPFQYFKATESSPSTGSLTFNSTKEDDGELTLGGNVSQEGSGQNISLSSGNYAISNTFGSRYNSSGYASKTFSYWSVEDDSSNKLIFYNTHYGISIGDYEVTKINQDMVTGSTGDFTYITDGSYLLVPNNNTLTGDYEIKSHRADLNIQISGDCTLKAIKFELNSEEFGTPETKTLNISASSSTSGKNSLTIDTGTDSSVPAISGFSSVNLSEDLHFVTPETAPSGEETFPAKVVISDEVTYDLWVEGQRVTSRNKDNVKGEASTDTNPITPSVVYDSSNYILTLNNATISVTTGNESQSAVVSGLENLTVKFVGSTVFQKENEVTEFYGFKAKEGKTCNITFTAANEGSYFSIGTGAGNAISGFNKVTYNDGVAPYIWNENFRIAPITLEKPTFIGTYDEDTGKLLSVKIKCLATSTIDSNTKDVDLLTYDIIYTIDGGSETAYSDTEPITISGPCTLTAKTIFGNTSSDVATAKYFGAKQEVFTVAIGDKIEGTSWFTPEIKADDQIESEFMTQEEDESGIFEREGEGSELYLVAKKSGTTTVNASLWCEEGITTVLNSNIALTFNVGESLSSVFEGENTYGAIYSETAIQVPEGMTAYVITGIDEETGSVKTSDPLDFIPAKTAVLLEKGTDAIAMTHVPYTGTATAPTNNKLNYSDPNSPAKPSTTDNWYVLYNNKFVKVTTNTEVKGGKCYLNLNGTPAGTRGFYNIGNGEGTTAIREVKNGEVNSEKWGNGEWFDLQGRRLSAKPNKSGLYILNGKKIVIK